MRDVPPKLQAMLDTGAATICYCWKIKRKDGVVLGFTNHDRTLQFDGVLFEAESGFNGSAIETSLGLSADSQSVTGALKSNAINEQDITRGLYDGADVETWFVDWSDAENRLHLSTGFVGEIKYDGKIYEFEIKSYLSLLENSINRTYSSSCDCVVGDKRCRIDLTRSQYTAEGMISAIEYNDLYLLDGINGYGKNWFDRGLATWLTGENQGATYLVSGTKREGTQTLIEFFITPSSKVNVGDRIRLTVGCDKSAKTCRVKFGNLENFRGFPHMPGDDWVVGYPSTGGGHDGGSLLRG